MSELGDLLELMHGARDRYRTVRATVREWRHFEREHVALERAKWTAYAWVGWDDGEPGPETHESTSTISWAPPDRFRIERVSGDSSGRLVVQDGHRWSIAEPDGSVTVNDDEEHTVGSMQEYEHLFDPALVIGVLDLRIGERVEHAGRPALRVHATPREHGSERLCPWLLDGADRYDFLVDAERGVILESVALVDGEPAQVTTIDEIAFDHELAPALFMYEPRPDARVRRGALAPRLEDLTLDEAVRRAPFPLWKVPRVDAGWSIRVLFVDDDGEEDAVANIHYFREDAAEQFSIVQRPATTSVQLWPPATRELEHRGERVRVLEGGGRAHFAAVWLVRGETSLELHSQQLGAERLLELASSLVPA